MYKYFQQSPTRKLQGSTKLKTNQRPLRTKWVHRGHRTAEEQAQEHNRLRMKTDEVQTKHTFSLKEWRKKTKTGSGK